MSVDLERLQAMPKVSLHDHLDGGLRPQTLIELAADAGHVLPATNPDQLGRWFFDAANSGSLPRYLETFDHTVACMQTASALRRVAREWVEDHAAENVVYAETRWAPEQHLRGGLTLSQAVDAVRDGLAEGMKACAAQRRPILAYQLITLLRHTAPHTTIAELALKHRDDSVCGFDLAGPEFGFPASRHSDTFTLLRSSYLPITIHAGEADGPSSIADALANGATRIGHGARLVDDLKPTGEGWKLGRLAQWVRDRRIVLELCPSSNLQTGVAASIAEHPFDALAEADMAVTVNCDNRLMSATTLTREFSLLSEAFDYDLAEVHQMVLNAINGAFASWRVRQRIITDRIEPGFAALR